MLLAVFSDSHGNSAGMISAIERHRPDHVIFLGDGVRDAEKARARFPEISFTILPGNCDGDETGYAPSALPELEGVRIFAAHGHMHRVRFTMDTFCNSVYFSGSALGLYGHTHRPLLQEIRGMQILNPGSIGSAQSPTYALVNIENGAARCRILDLEEGAST